MLSYHGVPPGSVLMLSYHGVPLGAVLMLSYHGVPLGAVLTLSSEADRYPSDTHGGIVGFNGSLRAFRVLRG